MLSTTLLTPTDTALARAALAYGIYAAALHWQDATGTPLPPFAQLPTPEQHAWVAVVRTLPLPAP